MARFKFWKPKDSFFILEILPGLPGSEISGDAPHDAQKAQPRALLPGRVNGLLLGLDQEQRLTPRKFYEDTSWTHLSKRPVLGRWVGSIVIAADSSVAHTALVPVHLRRENKTHPLNATELENLLAQEVGKVFSVCRKEAGKQLKVDELDVILAASRVMNFRIDGHRVLNPLGFKASELEVVLELILTTRPVYEDIKNFAGRRQDFFFTELTRSELNVLQKTEEAPLSVLRLGETGSTYATIESAKLGQTIARGKFPFRTGSFLEAIEQGWLVNRETAEVVYEMYLRRDVSGHTEKAIGKLLAPAEKSFFKAFKEAKLKGPVYVESEIPLPWPLPLTKYGRKLAAPPLSKLLDHFGFRTDLKVWPVREEAVFRLLAPYWDHYFDRSDTTVNRWLRRHLNWLGSAL